MADDAGQGVATQQDDRGHDGPREFTDRHGTSLPLRFDQARLALFVFVAVECVGLILFLVGGSKQWFFLDEWDLLATRDGADLRDLLEPHNDHWWTLPILLYRALYRLFGLRTYVPYQLAAITLHLIAAALLRVLMRRAGVGPWIASAAASLFVLFGAGNENVVWAFQIGFSGALVFGLVALLLADHDGPIRRRDWLALGSEFAALMCSAVGVAMVLVVGIAVLLRRGWRTALFHTAPPGVLFGVWWLAYGRHGDDLADPALADAGEFVAIGLGAAFDAMGQLPGVGVALGLLLVVGLVLAWGRIDRREVRQRAAVPAATLIGAVALLAISAFGRAGAFGADYARNGRYVHLVAALVLPALGVAASAVAARWIVLAPAVCALLLIGIPGNVAEIDEREPAARGDRELILTLAHLPAAAEAPRSLQPARDLAIHRSIGWFRDEAAAGRIPRLDDPPPRVLRNATVRVSLDQRRAATPPMPCELISRPTVRHFERGQRFTFGRGWIEASAPDGYQPIPYRPERGRTIRVVNGPIEVRLAPVFGRVQLCTDVPTAGSAPLDA